MLFVSFVESSFRLSLRPRKLARQNRPRIGRFSEKRTRRLSSSTNLAHLGTISRHNQWLEPLVVEFGQGRFGGQVNDRQRAESLILSLKPSLGVRGERRRPGDGGCRTALAAAWTIDSERSRPLGKRDV